MRKGLSRIVSVLLKFVVIIVTGYYVREKLYWMLLTQDLEFGWQIVLGTFVGFCGAAFGSVGGVGGGGIFVPMLSLIIGFDPKSSTAISKCKR